jgi:hypothetical protein
MTTPDRKKHKGGDIVRFEPQDLTLINSDPTIRVALNKLVALDFVRRSRDIVYNSPRSLL